MSSRATAAVDRALDKRQRQAAADVERILVAAATVMERTTPADPRVSDIVAEAGTSNKTFYRYFTGKDDLILAVMERGVGIVASYLDHQMSKEPEPAAQIDRWIRGVLAQVGDPKLANMSRAVTRQLSFTDDSGRADVRVTEPLRDLLYRPISQLVIDDPVRATDTVFTAALGMMRRQLSLDEPARAEDIDFFITFCLKGLGTEQA
ncbi:MULTISPECIES: TetR/AcrR family transcriptional regulator [Gordonia]|jgi:AcrR family transcriptional regulator|uniref:TetR/AcrR family transcriptional regulator n=3 Tax=Gordonia TaxID=2053 RepID=A0AAW6RDH0_GORRU|nr:MULTISPECIES: TetR/AcrR family transcriptional regulator [Gordonia]ASR03197.1 Transcriptional regulator, TetR family [Gordonia rubripertincta]AZG45542.1 putative HTH-type transcriptional regulator YvdT [Gordonia insulae]MDG6782037.1 TetR/AcrR family transcriptional regulator [Gordonia rubripertincta]NKY64598.1 TetR/AcrR family transcriptional regulator [Gordonia rubripertincta]GAB86655.1 putative TetR family transcriptional regulator [Gordonia rubripertincta NBRC 101908]